MEGEANKCKFPRMPLKNVNPAMFINASEADNATRDASWPVDNAPSHELPDEIKEIILKIKACAVARSGISRNLLCLILADLCPNKSCLTSCSFPTIS